MSVVRKHIALVLITLLVSVSAFAQPPETRYDKQETRILFILDASFSMYGLMGSTTKMQAARNTLRNVAKRMEEEPNAMMALRVFGHQAPQSEQDCTDSKLEVGFRANNTEKLIEAINAISPHGITPIAYSLGKAAGDFRTGTNTRNIIILITDGFESCEANACEVSRELQRKGIAITPYIIGLQVEESRKDELECIGNYVDVFTQEEMESELDRIINRIVNTTFTKVHLMDENNQPTETDANMTFYNTSTQTAIYNYYHTMTNLGEPDTLFIEPSVIYDLVIHTNPPIRIEDIQVASDTMNIYEVDAPQGYLKIEVDRNIQKGKIRTLIREEGKSGTLLVQTENEIQKYISGYYELDILTLPRIHMDSLKIDPTRTTIVQVPKPGVVSIKRPKTVYGEIYVLRPDGEEEIYRLNSRVLTESLHLQPGTYKVVYRDHTRNKMEETRVKTFEVESGASLTIHLNN